MTEDPERELTPEEDARIRSLLASARSSARVPDDVAARLDTVLADLASDRTTGTAASGPRRRRAGAWLLAAAAASVATIAVANLPFGTGSTNDSTSSTTSLDAPSAGKAGSGQTPAAPSTTTRLRTQSFRGDVRRLLTPQDGRFFAPRSATPGGTESGAARSPRASACVPPQPAAGVVQSRLVLLDGKPALLEIFAVRDGARVVRAVSCDGTETLASTRVPAR